MDVNKKLSLIRISMSCCRKNNSRNRIIDVPYCLSESICNVNLSANFQGKGSKALLSDYPHALQCSSDPFISYFISYAQFHHENSQGLTISIAVSWLRIKLPVKCVDGFGYLAGEFYVFLSSQVTSCFRVNFTLCKI